MSRIGAVILAAGTASRMKMQKLLLPLAGQPLLGHVLDAVAGLAWADCLAVIGEPEAELAALCQAKSIRAVYNDKRQLGQATSIVLATEQLAPDLDGIIFLLGDQPLVSRELLTVLTDRFEQADSDKAIIVPCCQGQQYSPVLFGGYWRAALAALTGDTGGRQIIRVYPRQVVKVNWPEPAAFCDADTWEDYCKLIFEQKGKF